MKVIQFYVEVQTGVSTYVADGVKKNTLYPHAMIAIIMQAAT